MVPDRWLKWILVAVVLMGVILRVVFFAAGAVYLPPNADESILSLQAKDICRGQFHLLFTAQPYQFPLESYLIAPLIHFLPRNAVGARLPLAAMTFGCMILGLLVLRRLGSFRETWPGVILVLFPSAYFLTIQSANALSNYSVMMLLVGVILHLTVLRPASLRGTAAVAAAAGLAGGLAISNHLLVLPVALAAWALVCLDRNWKRARVATPALAAGTLVGMLPYFIAKWTLPGAYVNVAYPLPWGRALRRLWDPMLGFTLPTAMGIHPPLYPDNFNRIEFACPLGRPFAVLWIVLVLAATGLCLWRFVARLVRDRWPSLDTNDVVAGICWLTVILCIISSRSNAITYRYLLFAVWCFPFLLAFLYARSPAWLKVPLGTLAAALAALNVAVSTGLLKEWSKEGFAAKEAELFDTRPALEFLGEQGIRHCFASHWLAYRLTFEADEEILFSQPFNERFFGWPIPYRDRVNASANAAYVLAPRLYMVPEGFEADMEAMGVRYRMEKRGDISIYWDFRENSPRNEERIPRRLMAVSTSHNNRDARRLADGVRETWWRSPVYQKRGMWIEATLKKAMPIGRATLCYNSYPYDLAASVTVSVRTPEGWKTVAENVGAELDKFEFVNGHPLYGEQCQTIRFPSAMCDAVRIEIAEAVPKRAWTVGEVELYRPRTVPVPPASAGGGGSSGTVAGLPAGEGSCRTDG